MGAADHPSAPRARVLVVEDDAPTRGSITQGLCQERFEVTAVGGGDEALSCWKRGDVDLVVLDLGLPGVDGWTLLAERERLPAVPVIVLTARTDVSTRVRAFAAGAVDYLAKPFFMAELVARVRARLPGAGELGQRIVSFGDVVLDLDAHAVTASGHAVTLTPAEYAVLVHLVERPGRAISRAALAEHALPEGGDRFDRTVDSHLSRLRTKLGPEGAAHLRTVWGIGWRFDP